MRNLDRQKWIMNQQKMKVFEKHQRISERLQTLKSNRASLQEFSRMANEVRALKHKDLQLTSPTAASKTLLKGKS